jgi:hypothetical protein
MSLAAILPGEPPVIVTGENTAEAKRQAGIARGAAAEALETLEAVQAEGTTQIDAVNTAGAAQIAGLQAEVDTLIADAAVAMSGTPKQPSPTPMVFFGQDSADKLAADSPDGTRRIGLPAGAIQRPTDTSDWFTVSWFRTGQQVSTGTQREVVESNGASFETTSGSSGISLAERANNSAPGGPWGFNVAIQNTSSKSLFKGLAPALSTQRKANTGADYCVVRGVSNHRPYIAIMRVGASAAHFRGAAQDIRAEFNEFYFPAAAWSNATVERSGGVITVRKASLAGTFDVGKVVLLQSVDHPEINGVYTIASRLASNAGFTVNAAGADFAISAANASAAIILTPIDLIDTIGGQKTATGSDNLGWGGGYHRIEQWWGTMPITNGLIDMAWLSRVTHRQLSPAQMPGIKRFGATANGAGGMTVDADGVVTGAVTLIGTPSAGPTFGTDWLVLDPWPGHAPFASDFDPVGGTATGTVRIGYRSFEKIGALLASVEDANGNTLVAEQIVSEGTVNGVGTITISGVPNGINRFLRIRPTAGAAYTMLWGPFAVGPALGFISQSTIDTWFKTAATGAALAPVSSATGVGTVGDTAGGLIASGTNPTDAKGDWLRLAKKHVSVAGSAGDAIKAFTNKLVSLLNAATGNVSAAAAYNFCRSGHPAEAYWSDRKTLINAIGTATAGVAKAGTWQPHPMWASTTPVYVEKETPKLYRGGTLAQSQSPFALNGSGSVVNANDPTDPYILIGGTQVATLDANGNWSGAVSGTFNVDNGTYSITDPVGGDLFISGKMQWDTPASSTTPRQTPDGFTAWGDDAIEDSGHISNLLKATTSLTAFVYSWANYLLSYATGKTQAEVNAKVAFDIAMIRKRIDEHYPLLSGLPWIIMADPRTTSTSSIGEQRLRKALRAYAMATPNTYWSIGPITYEMDGLNSPHPGSASASGPLGGITAAHGVAKVMGVPGAKAEEVYITQAVRAADGSYMDLVFNVPAGANLSTGDASKIEGLYFNTTDSMAGATYVDVVGGTYSTALRVGTSGRTDTVRVTPASGAFPATTYWAVNVGFVLQDAVFATENARLANTLSLDTGGYDGIRPGQPVSFNFVNVLAA